MIEEVRFRKPLIIISFIMFTAIVFGLFWFFFLAPRATNTLGDIGWFLFSFAAGLSMIVLPCTLPLAFVIVPLSMGKGVLKGFLVALAFGIGVAITLSMYGVVAAVVGKVAIGTIGAPLETVKNWLYFVAGAFAYVFALGELGLVKFRMPTYSGALPGFIQKQQDLLKALLLGLFLGNIGIGCPHPATPVILTQIAATGDIFYGWSLFFIHAIGRIIPLVFLAVLGILGVNALKSLVKYKDRIERATGWGMVFVAGFILTLGFFTHDWWVASGQHTYLESLTQEEYFLNVLASNFGVANVHHHGMPAPDRTGLLGFPLSWGTWVLLFLWILPLFWDYKKKKKEAAVPATGPPEELQKTAEVAKNKFFSSLLFSRVLAALLLVVIFGFMLPYRFQQQSMTMAMAPGSTMTGGTMTMSPGTSMSGMSMPGMNMVNPTQYDLIAMNLAMHGPTRSIEAKDWKSGVGVQMTATPKNPKVGEPVRLDFFSEIKPEGKGDGQGIPESDLTLVHSKKMHLIGARSDLNGFFHIHPVTVADRPGSILSVTYTFDKPGDYKMWPEIAYKKTNYVTAEPILHISGDGPTNEKEVDLSRNKVVKNATSSWQVKIDYGTLGIGYNHIDFYVKNPDGSFAPLENYLDAQMHLSVVSENLEKFIHTHPLAKEKSQSTVATAFSKSFDDLGLIIIKKAFAHGAGGDMTTAGAQSDHITFLVPFVDPGYYKMFAQFRPAGIKLPVDQALAAEFWVQVGSGAPAPAQQPQTAMEKLRIAIVSIILMILLSWWVKKYLTVEKT